MNRSDSSSTSWQHYQQTMTVPSSICFDHARAGNLQGLSETLGTLRDINEKDAKGYSVLMLAAYNGHAPMTDFLIAQGADVNTCDAAGNSVLMGAAFKGHADVVRRLLGAGAHKNYQNPKGQTALQFSHLFARREVVPLLSGEGSKAHRCSWPQTVRAWTQFLWSALRDRQDQRALV